MHNRTPILLYVTFGYCSAAHDRVYRCTFSSNQTNNYALQGSTLTITSLLGSINITTIKRSYADTCFDVLLTVHLSIFILVINQLDAQNFCFTISLFHASTSFEHMCSKHVEA